MIPTLQGPTAAAVVAEVLAHFLWQGVVALAVALAARRLMARVSSDARYGVQLAIFLAMAAAPLATAAVIAARPAQARTAPAVTSAAPQATRMTPAPRTAAGRAPARSPLPSPAAPPSPAVAPTSAPATVDATTVCVLYAVGVAAMLARVAAALAGGRSMHRRSAPLEDPAVLAVIGRQAARLGMYVTPAVAVCARLAVPCVVGVLRPVLLVPPDLAAALGPRELAWVIGHELAHIRRRDHVVLFFQMLVESLLFFHPAVWVVSRMVSAERECCCDDVAVGRGEDRRRYGDVLLSFARRLGDGPPPAASLAAVRARSDAAVRIARLLRPDEAHRFRTRGAWLSAAASAAVALGVLWHLPRAWADADPPAPRPSLHETAARGRAGDVAAAVAAGAEVDAADPDGWTALHHAAAHGRPDLVAALLAAGADPERPGGATQRTPIQVAVGMIGRGLAQPPVGNAAVLRLLTARVKPPPDRSDSPPLMMSLATADLSNARVLAAWQPVDLRDPFGRTALHVACGNASPEAVDLLLAAGADPTATNDAGAPPATALLSARRDSARSRAQVASCLDKLAARGARVTASLAALTGRDETLAAILRDDPGAADRPDRGAQMNGYPLHYAAEVGNLGAVRMLISAGARPLRGDKAGLTPLDWGVYCDATGAVTAELAAAAGPAAVAATREGATALHRAAGNSDPAATDGAVRSLLAAGAPVGARDARGMTPLHRAAANRGPAAEAIVRALLAAGADPGATDNAGRTPADLTPPTNVDVLKLLKQ